jgi:hypothetical protein
VGPRAGLDAVSKRKIPSPRRVSNPDNPIVQPVVSRYSNPGSGTNACQGWIRKETATGSVLRNLFSSYSMYLSERKVTRCFTLCDFSKLLYSVAN